jgi:prepilin-type N-terminal cleavage/methylation domain-containing protein
MKPRNTWTSRINTRDSGKIVSIPPCAHGNTIGDHRERGFSMIELIVVATISVILSAIAVPLLLNVIYTSRIRGAASDLSGLIQQARILAEQQNIALPVYTGSVGTNAQGAFIGTSGNTWVLGEPVVPYGGSVTNGSASSAPTALSPGFTAELAGTILYFSGRGLPVKPSGSTYIPSNGVIFYLTDTRGDWAAVSVTGAGRSKTWFWSGSWN